MKDYLGIIYHCCVCNQHYTTDLYGKWVGKLTPEETTLMESIGYRATSGFCTPECLKQTTEGLPESEVEKIIQDHQEKHDNAIKRLQKWNKEMNSREK